MFLQCPVLKEFDTSTEFLQATGIEGITELIDASFPNRHDEDDSDDSSDSDSETGEKLVDTLVGFHDAADVHWATLTVGKRVIGLVSMVYYTDCVNVFNLCVHPDYRGRRHGTRLLYAMNDKGRRNGYLYYFGTVAKDNPKALMIYQRLGARAYENGISSDNSSVRWWSCKALILKADDPRRPLPPSAVTHSVCNLLSILPTPLRDVSLRLLPLPGFPVYRLVVRLWAKGKFLWFAIALCALLVILRRRRLIGAT
eukprot:TRINITY_DN2411_c0_g2_i1.p1 TRINITY_DN2411_c0_g2~~TRINITY_DN2411_c0_g2_i1.p1  ORF type:complete len:255 (+),score=24.45 TRINITY_DN2411_c0_g2_i1:314-1078(+)